MGYSLVFYMLVVVALATTHGIEGNISLSLSSSSNAFADDLQRFIRAVRRNLADKTDRFYGIPVLRNNVPNSERFLLFNLNNGGDESITLAIDVQNVRFVAYCAKNTSYIFLDAPQEALHGVFPTITNKVFLDFKSDYESMEAAAGITRMELRLARIDFDDSISDLFHYNQELLPQSFLLLTQMLLESLKFKFIEQSIVSMLRNSRGLYPGLAMLSLENNWVKLSSKIQASVSLQGVFGTTVDLYDSNDEIIRVDSIHYPIITNNIALMLYRCEAAATSTMIRMPSDHMSDSDSDSCYVGRLRRNTRITGREGLCMNTKYEPYSEEISVTLKSCREQVIRDWIFKNDGTIQTPFGYCLTFNFKNFVVVSNCSKVEPSTTKWKVSIDGTITNLNSRLALTANASTSETKLRVEANTKAFGQGWRVGSYVDPITTTITGLYGMCLEATNKNTNTWLEKCVKNKKEQSWALYGDGSIRVYNDRNLCVSSPTDGSAGLVSIFSCVGSANQRWVFKVDGRIMNPKTEMGLAVERGDVSLKRVILQPTTGNAGEEWTLFY